MKFQGEVAWKDKQGNAGIRFLEAAPRHEARTATLAGAAVFHALDGRRSSDSDLRLQTSNLNSVILSGADSSHRELSAESKDPYKLRNCLLS